MAVDADIPGYSGPTLMRLLLEEGGRVRAGDEWNDLVAKAGYKRSAAVNRYFGDADGGFTKTDDGYVTFSKTAWTELGKLYEYYACHLAELTAAIDQWDKTRPPRT
jgi:hypothetical protein